jgi:iron(III) transport system ATP-binding protein
MTRNATISIGGLEKVFPSDHGPVQAVRGIDLDVADEEFVVLLGPSGCGKTTTLRCVAGLERPDSGSIQIAGQIVDSADANIFVPPDRRDIGMVFQSYAVWPHLNVFQNVALPLTDGRCRVPKSHIRERVLEALQLVRLEELERRPVTDLSGGQQQRVALARAIVTHPTVLLMDEPLSNLDARLREQMRFELKRITKSVGVTTLYVTHDQAEALSLGDRVCVMDKGEILQIGPPREIYSSPPNLFVAQFVGDMNFVKGRVTGPNQIESPLGAHRCPVPSGCEVGSLVTLAIRPEHLSLLPNGERNADAAEATIIGTTYLGDAALLEVEIGTVILLVKLPGDLDFTIGQKTWIVLPQNRWHVFP